MPGRALVVDDSATMRDILSMWLTALGWEVAAAPDGPSALTAALLERPDLLITDKNMPGMSGIDLVEHVRAASLALHVLVISADTSVETLAAALAAGADDCLAKPLTFDTLSERLDRLPEAA